jgi:hypothetical protein
MRQRDKQASQSAEETVRDIRRATRRHFSAEEKIRMDWGRFLLANSAGGILWASVVGFGAYALGRAVLQATGPLGIGLVVAAVAGVVGVLLFMRSHEAELEARAEQALPGPLRPARRVRTRRPV